MINTFNLNFMGNVSSHKSMRTPLLWNRSAKTTTYFSVICGAQDLNTLSGHIGSPSRNRRQERAYSCSPTEPSHLCFTEVCLEGKVKYVTGNC